MLQQIILIHNLDVQNKSVQGNEFIKKRVDEILICLYIWCARNTWWFFNWNNVL